MLVTAVDDELSSELAAGPVVEAIIAVSSKASNGAPGCSWPHFLLAQEDSPLEVQRPRARNLPSNWRPINAAETTVEVLWEPSAIFGFNQLPVNESLSRR